MESKYQEPVSDQLDWEFDDYRRPTIFDPLETGQVRSFKISSLFFYVLAYFYAASLVDNQPIYYLPIAAGLIGLTEYMAKKAAPALAQLNQPKTSKIETKLFLALTLGQALALTIWGFHRQLEFFQFLAIHLVFVFYVLARTDWLSQGRLGVLVWYDSIQGFLHLPFKNFLAAFTVLAQGFKEADSQDDDAKAKKIQQLLMLAGSLLVAGILVIFVWSQLSQVSESFAALFRNTASLLDELAHLLFAKIDQQALFIRICITFPVALYLYGLVAGSLLGKKDRILSYQAFQSKIQPLRVFPAFAVYIIIGSLCLTYALFFLSGLTELGQLLGASAAVQDISPQNASSLAVAGFWQLVRVSLLNFAVLGGFYLLAKKPLWDQKGTRLATTLLFIFASLLALLAAWKLFGIYIFLYGPTPLRLLSGWFVLVLLVWCLLTLIRLYKPIQAIRIGIFYALISFTLLCYLYPLLLANYRP